MSGSHKISLPMAILINVNIMLGAGIFVNTAQLAKYAGGLGALAYAIVGLLLIPLIVCIAELLKIHPSGGFYTYARQELSPLIGFISAWSFIIAKLASATMIIHASMNFMQILIPKLQSVNILALDGAIVCAYVGLNLLNMRTGGMIQTMFIVFKIIPIFFAISVGLFLFNGANFAPQELLWSGIPSAIPLVFYAAMGFESACSLSSKIENARRNAPLAIFISYGIVISILVAYQTIFYGALGNYLMTAIDYRVVFPELLRNILPAAPELALKLGGILNLAIASSALGGAYGIIFSNTWNVYALAEHRHLFASDFFARLNRHAIPVGCVALQGAICLLYIFVSRGNQVPLQQLAALGVVITYTISVIALMAARKYNPTVTIHRIIPFLGLVNCAFILAVCVQRLIQGQSVFSLIAFSVLLGLGLCMFMMTKKTE